MGEDTSYLGTRPAAVVFWLGWVSFFIKSNGQEQQKRPRIRPKTTGGGEPKKQTQKRFLSICLVTASMLLSKVSQSDLPWLPRTRPEPHRWLTVRVAADAAGLPGIRGSSMPNIFMRKFGVLINSIPEYDG